MKKFELSANKIGLIRDLAGTNFNHDIHDDHGNGMLDHTKHATGVLVTETDEIPVLLVKNAEYFCLNEIYFGADGEVHLSKRSVGGIVDLRYAKGLIDAICKYNLAHRIGNDNRYSEETLYIVGKDGNGKWVEKAPGLEDEFIF